jgi:hypothetical protein
METREDTAAPVRLANHRKILSKYNGSKTLFARFDSKTSPFLGGKQPGVQGQDSGAQAI